MKINPVYYVVLIVISALSMGSVTFNREKSVEGTWIRKEDQLKIRIDNGRASIIDEGNQKFPCDVSALSIYKDIQKVKDNLWTCNFLAVTMGSCNTNYESGEMFIDKKGELVVICPGFSSKVYSKLNPRYDASKD